MKIEQSNNTQDKTQRLVEYFSVASDTDKLWAVALLTGKNPKRLATSRQLRAWCCDAAAIPDWLYAASYQSVGNLPETIALLLPSPTFFSDRSLDDWMTYFGQIEKVDESEKKRNIQAAWEQMSKDERIVFNKIATSGFRFVGMDNLVSVALAQILGMDKSEVAHRLSGNWRPSNYTFGQMFQVMPVGRNLSKPYPFCHSGQLTAVPEVLGNPSHWLAEWKWNGLRAQIVKRSNETFIWSSEEELMTDKFPEIVQMAEKLPDGTVINGVILPCIGGRILSPSLLQKRAKKTNQSKKLLNDFPVVFFASDLLEWKYLDIRHLELEQRREILEGICSSISDISLAISDSVIADSWEVLAKMKQTARLHRAEGIVLKDLKSPYGSPDLPPSWWDWKVEPLSLVGVLVYVEIETRQRESHFASFTFGVWDGDTLVAIAKTGADLPDAELSAINSYMQQNTLEKFGPVRTVKPGLVFEIAFDGIEESSRHKSGLVLSHPRVRNFSPNKGIGEANKLSELKNLLNLYGNP